MKERKEQKKSIIPAQLLNHPLLSLLGVWLCMFQKGYKMETVLKCILCNFDEGVLYVC